MELITLIACHIDCTQKLTYFLKLLTSINNQIDYFETIDVRISISYNNKQISIDEIMYLTDIMNKNNFKFVFQENLLSRFEHYKFLTNELISENKNLENTWILFSNDDDEWANNRLGAYHCMIKCIPPADYQLTLSLCYTDKETMGENQTYLGYYTDYCIKLKYLQIFIDHLTDEQLVHKFCDCYFVKFINSYGHNILRRAFCSTDDTLYEKIDHPDYEKPTSCVFEECIVSNLDLYIAKYYKPTAKNWLKFCEAYSSKVNNGELSEETKIFVVKLYLDKYIDHLFADKHLPDYKIFYG